MIGLIVGRMVCLIGGMVGFDSGGGAVGWAGICFVLFESAEAEDQREAKGGGGSGDGQGAAV